MTPADIDRLLELEAKASPNWEMGTVTDGAGNVLPDRCWITLGTQPDGEYHCEAEFTGHGAVANAEFSLAARNLARPLAEQARRVPELEAEIARLTAAADAEMLRVKACEHIATGDEGWGRLRNECPSTAAVAGLRDAFEKAEAALAAAREEIARLIENCRSEWDEVSDLSKELAAAREENERLRGVVLALANAADDVGVSFFDTDDMPTEVEAMQKATQAARAAFAKEPQA